jgi:hypothetical protein
MIGPKTNGVKGVIRFRKEISDGEFSGRDRALLL